MYKSKISGLLIFTRYITDIHLCTNIYPIFICYNPDILQIFGGSRGKYRVYIGKFSPNMYPICIDSTCVCYEKPGRNSLEDSLWAPNENTCEGKRTYRAKIASVSLPGESREERIKFVRGTIYRSNHISKIEECFIKGNTWVVISFDCLKGIELLKERLNKKKSEWYKVLFEEHEE